jgi:hypothetical protein
MNTRRTKRDFILSLPDDLPAKDAVKKGAEEGFEFTEGYVYVTRSNARVKRAATKASRKNIPARTLEKIVDRALRSARKEIVAGLRRFS